jgi:hypothetical protein
MTLNTWKNRNKNEQWKKWAKFMYMGGETRFIIKLLKHLVYVQRSPPNTTPINY